MENLNKPKDSSLSEEKDMRYNNPDSEQNTEREMSKLRVNPIRGKKIEEILKEHGQDTSPEDIFKLITDEKTRLAMKYEDQDSEIQQIASDMETIRKLREMGIEKYYEPSPKPTKKPERKVKEPTWDSFSGHITRGMDNKVEYEWEKEEVTD